MTRKACGQADPVEREMESALAPGRFIGDRACHEFVRGLEEVEAKVAEMIQTDPARVVRLYETFLAASHEKVEELDDSSGSFGEFVGDLFCGWIGARQASGADREQTADRLLAWMEDDPYGFCHGLEKEAAKRFDKAGLAAFEKRVRARFETAATADPVPGASLRTNPDYARRRWGAVLRALYHEKKDVAAYVALAEVTGLTPEDCQAIATMLVSRRKPEEALAWVERGIALDKETPHGSMAGHGLARLKRALFVKLGRSGEALEATWAEYRTHPSKYAYDDLMKFVPKGERAAWHEKAVDAAKDADLGSLIELLLATKEIERLAAIVRRRGDGALEDVSHFATEPAAKKLEKSHPDLAARLWRAQGMRIVNAKRKSKYYDAALQNFERAKRLFEKAGLAAEWEKTVAEVRTAHHRKTRFISGFEGVVAGSGPSTRPSFLERAKARWGSGRHGGRGA